MINNQQIQALAPGPAVQMLGTPDPRNMISTTGVSGANPAMGISNAFTDPLVRALKAAKANNLLKGKLVAPVIGAGTAGSDIGTGPQAPPPQVGPSGGPMNA